MERSPVSRWCGQASALLASGALILVGAPTADAGTDGATIDTWSSWMSGTIGGFGHPDSSTYGQVITVPAGKHKVRWFTYYMQAGPNTGTLKFRGEVYGWDGAKATVEVAETSRKKLDVTAGDPDFYPVRFKLHDADVDPGEQYVLFATISKDYERTDPGVWANWPLHDTDPLAGGNSVWINDTGDESRWTTEPWVSVPSFDMAFKAKLS